ncbi:MAG: helix-turn-helix domain-containing protein [archaeon]
MVKATREIRLKTVIMYTEGVKTAKEISQLYNISDRTLRRWYKEYLDNGID